MIRTIVASIVFLGFVGGGFVLLRESGTVRLGRKRAVNVFLAYTVLVTGAIGLSQRTSLFPFHMWTLFGPPAPDSLSTTRWMGVDQAGEEHAIDFRAWQPISFWELRQWFDRRFPRLSGTQQEVAAQFLLELAEHARVRGREDLPIGNFDRVLGPLAIPLFHTYRPIWNQPTDVPAAPFLGLRWYRITWNRAAWSDPERVWRAETPTSELHYEYFARP